jgi:hypothetical protein
MARNVLILLLLIVVITTNAQEFLSTKVTIPTTNNVKFANDDEKLEFEFALTTSTAAAAAAKQLCPKLKSSKSKINFGCEKGTRDVKEVKKIWEKNEENSDFEALGMLSDDSSSNADAVKSLMNSIMEDVLSSAKIESGGKMHFGKPEITGRVLFACGLLNNCLKSTLTPEERVGLGEYLLSIQPITSAVALGLKALSDFGMTSVTTTQSNKAEDSAKVSVTSLLGKPLKWKLGKNTSKLISLKGTDEVKVQFDPKVGKIARVPVEVELTEGPATSASYTFHLEFDVKAEFAAAKIMVKEKNAIKQDIAIGQYPSKVEKPISLDLNQIVEFTVQVMSGNVPFCPDQAIFALYSENGEYQVPCSCTDKEVKCSISNNLKLGEELRFSSGTFELRFITSDEKMSNPTLWNVGKAQVTLSSPPERKHEPLFTHSLLHESDTTLKPLPEIHHQFREPDRRAPTVLAFAFTCLQLGFLLALLVTSFTHGFNPLNIFKSFRLMFFTATLTVFELVLMWYWIAPSGAPNMESLAYKYLPPMLFALMIATRNVFPKESKKKNASM